MNICMQKIGMNQMKFKDSVLGVTFLWCQMLKVLGHKTIERDGYSAMILGFGNSKIKSWNNPQRYLFKNTSAIDNQNLGQNLGEENAGEEGVETKDRKSKDTKTEAIEDKSSGSSNDLSEFIDVPQIIYEYRAKEILEIGSFIVPSDLFGIGSYVDVAGTTKGRGFTGVMKRWNFDGLCASHGVSKAHRKGGSTGQRTYPGRVFKGKKMPGHYGSERITTQSLKVVFSEEIELVGKHGSIIGLHGAVPGANTKLCFLKHAVKKGGA